MKIPLIYNISQNIVSKISPSVSRTNITYFDTDISTWKHSR